MKRKRIVVKLWRWNWQKVIDDRSDEARLSLFLVPDEQGENESAIDFILAAKINDRRILPHLFVLVATTSVRTFGSLKYREISLPGCVYSKS
jgi:hypothetical protein